MDKESMTKASPYPSSQAAVHRAHEKLLESFKTVAVLGLSASHKAIFTHR